MATGKDRTPNKRGAGRRPATSTRPKRKPTTRRPAIDRAPEAGEFVPLLEERTEHTETTPALTGGDIDADWERAGSSGEEAVGGTVATPDQDMVDELGRALGVEQPADAEVRTSDEILRERDRHYWHLERKAAEREEP